MHSPSLAVAKLGPIGGEMKRLVQDTKYIDGVLVDGAARARAIARRYAESGEGYCRVRARLTRLSRGVDAWQHRLRRHAEARNEREAHQL